MPTESCQESQVYKHAILCYATLTGEQPPSQFHFGLVDVVDYAINNEETEAKAQLALMSLRIGRLLVQAIKSRIELLVSHRDSQLIENIMLAFVAKIEQIDQFPDLDKCQATQMMLNAINKALKEVGPFMVPPIEYPDLEKLRP